MGTSATVPGEGVVALSLSAGTRSVTRELRTTPSASAIVYGDYAIKLTALQPHPFAGHPTSQSDYVATLTVSKE